MSCAITSPWDCVTSITGQTASRIAKDAFASIARDFGHVAASAIDWLWSQIGAATSVQLGGAGFELDLGIVAAIAGVVAMGLFVVQVITGVLRRDHGALARAGRGLLVAFLGSAAAITATNLLLSAVDALSNGVVEVATGGSIEQLGSHLLVASALAEAADPAGVLLLALVTLVAVVVVWFAMTVRKLLIIVTAVFAPVAFAGSLADISSSWVRRWVETTAALIVSKLVLVVIFIVGLGILVDGAGQAPASGLGAVGQTLTQAVAGLLVLCLAGFAPWLALRLVHFSGDHFAQLHVTGQHQFRARVTRPRPDGSLALPGDAAGLRLWVDPASGAAMVHDPHRQTLSAVLRVSHPAFVPLSPSDQAARVGGWGRALARLAQAGTCAALQVCEATVPDPGTGVAAWWESQGHHGAGWAAEQYGVLLETARLGSSTHRSTVSLALDMRAAARQAKASGRGVKGAAAVLRADMANLEHQLRCAELRVEGWLTPGELGALVRSAYDPAANLTPGSPATDIARAGPLAVSEHWDRLRHDTAWSCVLWLSEWPRIEVRADFLHALVFTPGVRKVVSLLARPVGTAEALRRIRVEKTSALADAAQIRRPRSARSPTSPTTRSTRTCWLASVPWWPATPMSTSAGS